MLPKVVPACQTPARDGTVVVTNSDRVRQAQAQTLEGHAPQSSARLPRLRQGGRMPPSGLQLSASAGPRAGWLTEKNTPPNKDHIGNNILLFTDRCIMCSRCVRFTREISGTAELLVINRGDHSEIDIFPGEPCNDKLAGNVVDHLSGREHCAARTFFTSSGSGICVAEKRLCRLQRRMQHSRRSEQGSHLSVAAALQSAGPGILHVRRGPPRLPLRQCEGAVHAAACSVGAAS